MAPAAEKQLMAADRGAYGLNVLGIDDGGALQVRDAAPWPQLRVETGIGPEPRSPGVFVTDRAASIATPVAHLILDRAMRRLMVRSREKLPDADLVHPCLWARGRGILALAGSRDPPRGRIR